MVENIVKMKNMRSCIMKSVILDEPSVGLLSYLKIGMIWFKVGTKKEMEIGEAVKGNGLIEVMVGRRSLCPFS